MINMNSLMLRSLPTILFFSAFLALSSPAEAKPPSRDCARLIEGIRARYDGKLNLAVRSFEEAIFERGDLAAAYLHLGLTWQLKGNHPEAKKYFERALSLRPGYRCAQYYLERLKRADSKTKTRLVDSSIPVSNPDEISNNFLRYKGKSVEVEGELICWPCAKGQRPILLLSTKPSSRRGSAAETNLDTVFIVELPKELPEDPRIRRGASLLVRGRVSHRDFAWDPNLKVFSAKRKPVLVPDYISIEDDKSYTGPLNLTM